MANRFPWALNPAYKLFEIILARDQDPPLKQHKSYRLKPLNSKRRDLLRKELLRLPRGVNRTLYLKMVDMISDPPEEITIKNFLLSSRGEKVPVSYQIMADTELNMLIMNLALLNIETLTIKSHIANLPLAPRFTLESIDRYLYQFWNVRQNSQDVFSQRETLKDLLLSDTDLSNGFEPVLSAALSDGTRTSIIQRMGLQLDPVDRKKIILKTQDQALLKLHQLPIDVDPSIFSKMVDGLNKYSTFMTNNGIEYKTGSNTRGAILQNE
jgi:hypothetical protein